MKIILYAATVMAMVYGPESLATDKIQGMSVVPASVYIDTPAKGLRARWVAEGGVMSSVGGPGHTVGRLEITNDDDYEQQFIVASDNYGTADGTTAALFRNMEGAEPSRADGLLPVKLVAEEKGGQEVLARVTATGSGVDIASNPKALTIPAKSTVILRAESAVYGAKAGVYSGTFFIYNEAK